MARLSINFAEVNCAHKMADKSVWLNVEDEDAWVLCTVEGSTDSEVNLLRAHAPDGVSTKTTITMEAYKKLTPVTGDMSVPVHDLCLLEDVNTASLLHTLRQRYAVDDIYTAIGPIVVASSRCPRGRSAPASRSGRRRRPPSRSRAATY